MNSMLLTKRFQLLELVYNTNMLRGFIFPVE